jgi:hypothetical protein
MQLLIGSGAFLNSGEQISALKFRPANCANSTPRRASTASALEGLIAGVDGPLLAKRFCMG